VNKDFSSLDPKPTKGETVMSFVHALGRRQFLAPLALVACLVSTLPRSSQAQFTVDWNQQPGGVGVAVDASGNVFTARYDYNPAGDIYVLKRDPDGNPQWEASYDQTDPSKWEKAVWVDTDPAGNVVVCGTLMSGYSSPVNAASLLMKFNADGDLLWREVFDSPFDGSSSQRCLVDASGTIYVVGRGVGPNGLVGRVKAFSADGGVLWDWFDEVGIGAPVHAKLTPDGAILVSARGVVGSINGYAKVGLDGTTHWSLPGINSLTVGDAAGDAQGNSYVVHGEYVANGGTVVRKLDPAGDTVWSHVYPFSGFRVETGSDGLPVVCGFPNANQGGAAFVKLNDQGGLVWQNLDADGPQALLLHARLLLDSQDNAYLAAGTLFQMAVCKVNADGGSGWTALVGSGSGASAMDLGSSGRVVVTGNSTVSLGQPWEGLEAPQVDVHTDGPCQRHLAWIPVPGALGYRVWESTGLQEVWNLLGTTLDTQWALDCPPNAIRLYRVSAYND
jgi:hypothetical protein